MVHPCMCEKEFHDLQISKSAISCKYEIAYTTSTNTSKNVTTFVHFHKICRYFKSKYIVPFNKKNPTASFPLKV